MAFKDFTSKSALEHGIQGLLDSFGIDVEAIKAEIPKFLAMAHAIQTGAPAFIHGIEIRVVNMETRIANAEKHLVAIAEHFGIKVVSEVEHVPLVLAHETANVAETAVHDTETVAHDIAVDAETVVTDATRPILHAGEDIFQNL